MIRTSTKSQWRISFPTLLTLLRIALVPFIVHSMVQGLWGQAFVLFMIAAITDVLDGACARWWDDKTLLGACLDPIADKILIIACFFTLAFVQGPLFTVPLWFVMLVLFKELLLVSGIIMVFFLRGRVPMQPAFLGKLAMLVQTYFIVWLFACYFFHWIPVKTYYTMLGVVIAIVFASLAHYLYIGMQWLRAP